jgi:hypothetical protein
MFLYGINTYMITDIKVLDNFYTNPSDIVQLLNGEYPIFGCGTGNRSVGLQEISPHLYSGFCESIYAIHGIDPSAVHMTTFFMEHNYSPIEQLNPGWVHIDGKNPDACRMLVEEYKLLVCGVIFLTENPDPECGMGIYELKPTVKWDRQKLIDECINDYTTPRDLYNVGKISLDEYASKHKDYHDNFELTCDVKNKYNRMMSWRGGSLHGQKMTKKMNHRLNQYFFVSLK